MIRKFRNRKFNESYDDGYAEIESAALEVRNALRKLNRAIYNNLKQGDLGVKELNLLVGNMADDLDEILDAVGR